MLRITQQSSPDAARSYFSKSDYLAEGQELAGRWGGIGAKALGLTGAVAKEPFDLLCGNLRPDGEPLTQRTRADRTVGYDWTFSAPKSVSILYGLTGDGRLLDAFRDSVDETMREAEQDMKVRVRKGGADHDRVTGSMVWAEYTHTTARPVDGIPDPHLHSHVFVFSASFDGTENIWKSGQFRDLKRDARYYEAAFDARLSTRLADLGFSVERTRTGWEVSGLSKGLLKEFSRRTRVIEEKAARKGITDPERKAELGAGTREAKDGSLSFRELQKVWRDRLPVGGWEAVSKVANPAASRRAHADPTRVRQAAEYAIGHVFANQAVVPERVLVAEALRQGVGAATPDSVRKALREEGVIRRQHEGRELATTKAVLAEERAVIDYAKNGRATRTPIADGPHTFRQAKLNGEQRAAVEHVLHSTDAVTLIRGAAGTGKTTLMREAIEAIDAIKATGRNVAVLAPSVEASRGVLRDDGFGEADTVARFLQDERMQEKARWGVIWIDEAGLLPLKHARAVFDLADRLGARVVLSGDRAQHTSVERGDLLKLLEDEARLPKAEVTEIQRQEHAGYKQAVKALSAGEVKDGLSQLDQLGWVHEIADEKERLSRIAEDYCASLKELKDPRQILVVSPTHREGDALTAAIRERLKAEPKNGLGEEHVFAAWEPVQLTEAQRGDALSFESGMMLQFHKAAPGHQSGSRMLLDEASAVPTEYAERFTAYRPAELHLAIGDRVRVTAPTTTKDGKHRLARGALHSVKAISLDGDVVLDNGWVVGAGSGLNLTHGYCVTSHASQGRTVSRVIIAQSEASAPAASAEQIYVSASRAKYSMAVYTDQKASLFDSVGRSKERVSASELKRAPVPAPAWAKRRDRIRQLRRLFDYERSRPAGRKPEPRLEVEYG